MDINHQNHKGQTALDILEQAGINAKNKQLKALLVRDGDKSSKELSPLMPEIKQTNPPMETLGNPRGVVEEKELSVLHPRLDSRGVGEHQKDYNLRMYPSVPTSSSAPNSTEDFLKNQFASSISQSQSWKERMVLPTKWHPQMHLSKSCRHLPAQSMIEG